MRNKETVEKVKDTLEFVKNQISESNDKREKADLAGVERVLSQVLYRLGYRNEPKKILRTTDQPNPFKKNVVVDELKGEYDNSHAKPIFSANDNKAVEASKEAEAIKEEVIKPLNPTKEQEEARKKQHTKKVRTSSEEKTLIKNMHKNRSTIPEISETLWIEEKVIEKVLNVNNQKPSVIIADSSDSDDDDVKDFING